MISRYRWCGPRLASVVVLTLLTGCIHTRPNGPARPPAPQGIRQTTHVFVGNCIFRPKAEAFGGLIGAVLPSVITNVFNRVGSALAAAGKEHTWQAAASTNFELNKDHMDPCVQVVRGRFAPSAEQPNDWTDAVDAYKGKGVQLKNARIYLVERPDFMFEGAFRTSSDGSAMAIAPVFVDFNRVIGERALRNDPTRNLALSFAFHPPGKSATDASNASTSLVLGEMEPGSAIEFDHTCTVSVAPKAGTNTPSQPGGPPPTPGGAPPNPGGAPRPPAGSPSNGGMNPTRACADESLWFRLPRPDQLTQLSLTAVTTEVQGSNEFLVFLSDVFKGSSDELEKLAKQTLIEAEREKARLAAIQAENEAAVAYDKAATAALTALDACSTDGTIAKAGDARVKQQSANLAAAKAGRPQPFGTLVPLNGTTEVIQNACKAALTDFK